MRSRQILFYASTIGALLITIFLVMRAGHALEHGQLIQVKAGSAADNSSSFTAMMHEPLAVFLVQIIAIILASRLFGFLFKKIGQPAVVGEIVAGIVLGPSLFGYLLPGVSNWVFPPNSLGHLKMFSQVGLVLFMFVVGMELDWRTVRNKAGAAVMISHASIVIPYSLGVGLSYFLYTRFAPAGTPFFAFALFMGIAMSITAFPVLARMIRERNLTNTTLGTMALTCAAADDVTAWCILAIIIALVKSGSVGESWQILLMAVVYVSIMIVVIKPLMQKLAAWRAGRPMTQATLAIVFLIVLCSAWCSETIGIHALFGAFLAGVIMPSEGGFRQAIVERTEDVALVLLLPLFFVFTGLRTQLGLLNSGEHWLWCGIIVLLAVLGKMGGAALAACIAGESSRNSLALGALMNTRGLMELVVLNIGLELGILSPEIFTMMVIMALATTFMTSPILNYLQRREKKQAS